MTQSRVSSHMGTSDNGTEIEHQERLNDFNDLPEGPILIDGQLKKILFKMTELIERMDKAQKETKLNDDKVYQFIDKGLKAFLSIDATDYINNTKQFLTLSRLFLGQIKENVSASEQKEKEEAPKKEQKPAVVYYEKKEQEYIPRVEQLPKTVKKERVGEFRPAPPLRNIENDRTGNTIEQSDSISQVIPPSYKSFLSSDEPSRISARIKNMTSFVNWETKAYFEVVDRRITKLHNDNYRKICATRPLADDEQHTFRFRVLHLGTIAIGVVPERWKDGPFVEDRTINTFKYIGFYNGNGGIIKYNKDQFDKGKHLALRKGDVVQLKINLKTMIVHLKTQDAVEPIPVDIRALKDSKLYLYIEMKQKDTCIEFF